MCIEYEMVDSQHDMQHQVSNNHLISNKLEHEPTGKCFHNFFEFSQTSMSVSVTRRTSPLNFL